MPEESLQRRQRNISLYGGGGEGMAQDVWRYRPADTRPVRHAVHVVAQAQVRVLAPGVNEQVAANVEAAEPIDVVQERRARVPQIVSGSISIAPQGHSTAQMPQPLQKS